MNVINRPPLAGDVLQTTPFIKTQFQIKGARRHKIKYDFVSLGDPPKKMW